jgi:hypothetical protein
VRGGRNHPWGSIDVLGKDRRARVARRPWVQTVSSAREAPRDDARGQIPQREEPIISIIIIVIIIIIIIIIITTYLLLMYCSNARSIIVVITMY